MFLKGATPTARLELKFKGLLAPVVPELSLRSDFVMKIDYYQLNQLNSKQFGTGGPLLKQATYKDIRDNIYHTDIKQRPQACLKRAVGYQVTPDI